MSHRDCLKASLDGIAAVRTEPGQIFCARYGDAGRDKGCFSLFAIIPYEKEEELYKAISRVLWPDLDKEVEG